MIPASRVESYSPVEEGQRQLEIAIYQGEHAMCADNTRLGAIDVPLDHRAPEGRKHVDVRFTYDLNGLLEVDVTVHATGRNHQL